MHVGTTNRFYSIQKPLCHDTHVHARKTTGLDYFLIVKALQMVYWSDAVFNFWKYTDSNK